jgi:peptide/nickel transport system substrate-binding protein
MAKYLACLALACIISCSPKPETSPDQLTIGTEANPTNLDPRKATDVASARVTQLVFSSLLQKDPQSNLVPDLALRWEQPDDKTYLFYLRQGVKFHDGSPLTARDVKYTFESVLDPALKSPRKGSYEQLERIELLDDYTIKFVLKEASAPFLVNMVLGIVPQHIASSAGEEFSTKPVGSGPFKLTDWQPNEKLEFTAFEEYYAGPPKLKRITYKIVPENSVRILELEKGSVQFVQNSIPTDLLPRLQANPKLKVITSPGTSYAYIGFNMEDPILKIKRVRQALALAIDRPAIIKHLLGGLAAPARSLLPQAHWAYEPQAKSYEYDLSRAKTLLDKAGFPDPDGDGPQPRFQLSYKTSQNEQSGRIAEVLQHQWQKLGVKVEIRRHEWGTFYGDISSGNFQLYSLQWVGITEPDIYYYIFHSSSIPPQGANRGKYINPELDKLLEQGRITLDSERRKAIYSRVQKIVAEDLPYISLWHLMNIAAMHRQVNGFVPYPAGDLFSLKDVFIKP